MIGFFIKLILLAVFNISFFTITKASCNFSMWISYGFIHFAFLMFFISPLFTKKTKDSHHVAIKSLALINAFYFIATLGIGIFFIYNPLLTVFQYSIESCITGIYLIILIITISLNNQIAINENISRTDKMFLNDVLLKSELIKTKYNDNNLINEISKLQDDIKYSQTKSSSDVIEFEKQTFSILDEINITSNNENIDEILSKIKKCRDLLNQRNLLLKTQSKIL